MSCFICGRSGCSNWMHSTDEQEAFEPAEEAYEKFLEVREECRQEWQGANLTEQTDEPVQTGQKQ